MTKEHNEANVIALCGCVVQEQEAIEIADIWLSSTFEGGRRLSRVRKIEPTSA